MSDLARQRPHVGVGALIIRNGQVLLAKRRGSHGEGTYGSVGGHVEFGETPEVALGREAKEELGITLGNLTFLACTNLIFEGKHYVDLGFKADIIDGVPAIQPDEQAKIETVGWYDLDQLPQPLFEPIAVYLQALQSEQRYFAIST